MAEGGGGGHWIGSALATLPTGNLRWLLQQLAAVIIMMLCVMFMNIIGAIAAYRWHGHHAVHSHVQHCTCMRPLVPNSVLLGQLMLEIFLF